MGPRSFLNVVQHSKDCKVKTAIFKKMFLSNKVDSKLPKVRQLMKKQTI